MTSRRGVRDRFLSVHRPGKIAGRGTERTLAKIDNFGPEKNPAVAINSGEKIADSPALPRRIRRETICPVSWRGRISQQRETELRDD